ncbi:MAG: hypothetical protein EOP48_15130 [Sphingobacteriales bacterium]|nr:MAG: hypothetical protein EOP48_15130 [Sphingobacteriales bacterium]
MKTDPVEIFQTIRASLQPYASLGFSAEPNTEDSYQLVTEKRLDVIREDALTFARVTIKGEGVEFCLFDDPGNVQIPSFSTANKVDGRCQFIAELDAEKQIPVLEDLLSIGFKRYKENGWV